MNNEFLVDILRRQIMIELEQYERMLELEHTIHANELDKLMKKHFIELKSLMSEANVQTMQEFVELPQMENKNILKQLTKLLNKKELKL